MIIVRHIICFLFLLISLNVFAQQVEKISLTKYTQSDGLASYNIKQIIKDRQGFLWTATQDGLSRFDGHNFISYTKEASSKHRICAADVRKIIEDPSENILWVLPSDEGLNAINTLTGNVVRTVEIPKIDSSDWNITMTLCNNRLWIGSFSGLKIYDMKTCKFMPAPNPDLSLKTAAADFEIRSIAKDEFNNIWVCYSGYGIIIYNGLNLKQIKEIKLADLDNLKTHNIRFNNYSFISNNEILFATSQGIRKIKFNKNYSVIINNWPSKSVPEINTSPINCIEQIAPDEILICGNNQLYKFNKSLNRVKVMTENLSPSESDWLNSVQGIFHFNQNMIWLACAEGIAVFKANHFPFEKYFYDPLSKNKINHFTSINILQDSSMLVGMQNGLIRIYPKNKLFSLIDDAHLYIHMLRDNENRIFLFRDDGIYIYDKGIIYPVANFYPEFTPYQTYSINSHIKLGDSAILFGTENDRGILLWNINKGAIQKIDTHTMPSLGADVVNNIFKDKTGRVWVLSDNLITVIDKNIQASKIITFAARHQYRALNLFFDMCETNNSFWIASYGNGIIQLDSNFNIKKIIRSKEGLCNEGVYNIFNIGDSNLVITTNNGLSIYKIKEQKFKNYYIQDGLHSNAFEEVAATIYQNKIYAGGINGFTVIDPSKFTTNTTPPIFYFTSIQTKTTGGLFDTSNLELNKLKIPNNWLQTNISFVGINYSNPNRVTYQYRIKERNKNWIDLGTQNFVNLIGLSPGIYTLEVKAANEDGYWSQPKQLKLTFLPKWYQTLLFKILIFALVLTIPFAFYRYRLSHIKKQQQIRQGISSDLHDDIGATLNSVKLFTHLAINTPKKEEYLNQVTELLTQATAGLRDMIWVLDDSRDSTEDFISRIKQFATPVAEASNIAINFKIDEDIREDLFSKTEKRNLFLIAKEVINNSIKYANCDLIEVALKQIHKKVNLIIRDNGKGFDENIIKKGNGLINIRERARQINYTPEIDSSCGNGTCVTISKK